VYFDLKSILGWLGTSFLHATIIMTMVMCGADSLEVDRKDGHTWTLQQNGILMFSIVVVTVHLQLAVVLDQWMWMHHVAIWGSIGERHGGNFSSRLPLTKCCSTSSVWWLHPGISLCLLYRIDSPPPAPM
jgi:hypothetical protein